MSKKGSRPNRVTRKRVPPRISLVNGSKKTSKTAEINEHVSGNKRTRPKRGARNYNDVDDDDNEKVAQNSDSDCQSSKHSTIDKKGARPKRATRQQVSSRNNLSSDDDVSTRHSSGSDSSRSSQMGEDENEKNEKLEIKKTIARNSDDDEKVAQNSDSDYQSSQHLAMSKKGSRPNRVTRKRVPPRISLVNGSKKTSKTAEINEHVSGNKRTRPKRGARNYNDVDDDDNEKVAQNSDSDCQSSKHSTIDKKGARPKRATRQQVSSRNNLSSDDDVSTRHSSGSDSSRSSQMGEDENEEDEELKIEQIIARHKDTRKNWNHRCETMNTSVVDNGSRLLQMHDLDEDNDGIVEERYLVKWDGLSYLHCSWENKKDITQKVQDSTKSLRTFIRKYEDGFLFSASERGDGDFFDPSLMQIERILEVERNSDHPDTFISLKKDLKKHDYVSGRQFLVKWKDVSYDQSTYEFESDFISMNIEYEDHVDFFLKRSKKPTMDAWKKNFVTKEREKRLLYKIFGDLVKDGLEKDSNIEKYKKKLEEQTFPNGGHLRDYQAEGVSWLLANHVNRRSSILADEMGLGKTIQTVSYINVLNNRMKMRGPFLVVVPLSTVAHWYREFTEWTKLNTVVYSGGTVGRQVIREYEFAFESDRPIKLHRTQKFLKHCHKQSAAKWKKTWMAEVIIITPDILAKDIHELKMVRWELLVFDEAQRLKNHANKLGLSLRHKDFTFKHTLLLTGTPIQNTVDELWTLLNFIDPHNFKDSAAFLEFYGNMKSKSAVDDLHAVIRPYILRRLKGDVEKSVPPKEETVIEVELTFLQKQYYRALYEKNMQFLHRNKRAIDSPSVNNLAMQLRKCCNHPFLLSGVENETKRSTGEHLSRKAEADFLVNASGKLVLLDKLLPKLKGGGHRVLLFSNFTTMLDILQDYLDLRGFKYERIDGCVKGKQRQMAIDRYQAKKSIDSSFIMLLSTKAGGVGINLTAADTCIIYDTDWNPQNDIQAQARCHRIGQTKSVKVYRLLCRKTYEMHMFHMSSKKLGLEQAVLHGIENGTSSEGQTTLKKEEIENLLRHGAHSIFSEEKAGTSQKESSDFLAQDIDTILERRSTKIVQQKNCGKNIWSKASFKMTKQASDCRTTDLDDVDVDDPDFWTKTIGKRKGDVAETESPDIKQRRTSINYNDEQYLDSEDERSINTQSVSSDDAYLPVKEKPSPPKVEPNLTKPMPMPMPMPMKQVPSTGGRFKHGESQTSKKGVINQHSSTSPASHPGKATTGLPVGYLMILAPPGILGVSIKSTNENETVVSKIDPFSPLLSQLDIGDVICAVDNEDVTGKGHIHVSELFQSLNMKVKYLLAFRKPD